jgi:hypothetical protein
MSANSRQAGSALRVRHESSPRATSFAWCRSRHRSTRLPSERSCAERESTTQTPTAWRAQVAEGALGALAGKRQRTGEQKRLRQL